MKIQKTVLGQIDKVYAPCIAPLDGGLCCIGCTEGGGEARAWVGGRSELLWDGPGGTMNIVPVPGVPGTFFATQRFLPVFDAKACTLNLVRRQNGSWSVTEVMPFPYLHRFDLFEHDGAVYFVGATLCAGKAFQQDWSQPGAVYTAKLDFAHLERPLACRELYRGITKNHGLWHDTGWGEHGAYFVAGEQGAFVFPIPADPMADAWHVSKVLDGEVSDLALCDADGDGEPELAAIQPFHGSRAVLYHLHDGRFCPVWEKEIDFGHVVWGGLLAGQPAFLLGYRRQAMELFALTWEHSAWQETLVDTGTGPSQIAVCESGGRTQVLAANRQIGELALYEFSR